ncbi:GDSL-type esterase/lipase family protein [Chitinophaga arvensicola]|uniref:Lysophospholipase L1 n=1 Tax=Chitinophaga arvensicola TaxID=29529 RepID=A0A1I0S6L7_9BACT|nr:GDSL-type esterase/lipase family protein [Chitinophaga arvensicola]SEW51105.1 Lysophospholipase L1 [Chitinophaga arvensicola]
MMKKLSVALCSGILLAGISAVAQTKKLDIVFIGNSITQGGGLEHPLTEAPPVKAIEWLKQAMPGTVINYSNQGVSGSTTVDFLPATNRLFNNVVKAADVYKNDTDATLVFSMVLGTNDSAIEGPNGSPVSPEQYRTNVKAILDKLFSNYPRAIVILHRPIWYSANTQNSSRYLAEGQARLQSYFPVLDAIAASYRTTHPGQVFIGYKDGFTYFQKHPDLFIQEHGGAGIFQLHPNAKGAEVLGSLWGKAIKQVVSKLK